MMIKNIIKIWLLSSVLFIEGCSSDHELQKTVITYDTEFTDLPVYSEWGYNTFGAYYDRAVFTSSTTVPSKVIVENNNFSFELSGRLENSEDMTIQFFLSDYEPGHYADLVELNDTKVDLTSSLVQVVIITDSTEVFPTILSGTLLFKRAQHLYVDEESVEAILSGYFEFKALVNDRPVTLSNGRFDVGIQEVNFYVY